MVHELFHNDIIVPNNKDHSELICPLWPLFLRTNLHPLVIDVKSKIRGKGDKEQVRLLSQIIYLKVPKYLLKLTVSIESLWA
jgi:hypothetical protein